MDKAFTCLLCGKIFYAWDKANRKYCSNECKKIAHKGEGNPFYGKKHTDKTRKKMSKNHADVRGKKNPSYGKTVSEKTKEKLRQINLGKKLSEIQKEKIKIAIKKAYKRNPEKWAGNGKQKKEKIKQNLCECGCGELCNNKFVIGHSSRGMHNPMYGKKRILTQEWKDNISRAGKGRKFTEEHKKKIGDAQRGKKRPDLALHLNPNWKGGKSFEPYTIKFNNELKNEIRERDNHKCQICRKKTKDRLLDVHHIDYIKRNNDKQNLISLCRRCHSITTSGDREYWQLFLSAKIKAIYRVKEVSNG